jgi:hypothetical protein
VKIRAGKNDNADPSNPSSGQRLRGDQNPTDSPMQFRNRDFIQPRVQSTLDPPPARRGGVAQSALPLY